MNLPNKIMETMYHTPSKSEVFVIHQHEDGTFAIVDDKEITYVAKESIVKTQLARFNILGGRGMKLNDQLNKADLDILLKKLEDGEIGCIQEKSQYIKELEQAYLKTKENDSERFK